MHKEFVKDTDDFERRTARVIEEMAEAIAAYAKSQRFGWMSYDPTKPEGPDGEKNWEWFFRELQDVEDALNKLFDHVADETLAGRSVFK
jgi:hypothetical protein